MAFYDRLIAQAVQKYIDIQGNVEPLDVVPYGGAFSVTATVVNGGSVQLLPAPSAGFTYRLHSFAVFPIGPALLGTATILFSCLTATVPSQQLGGQLTRGAVVYTNEGAGTAQAYLTYDFVLTPTIN